MKSKLSVVISTHNEEKLLEGALQSVRQLADEIIIVDNESTNQTVEIAKRYTTKIYKRKNNPLILNQSKNFGFSKAMGDWVLSLDPDERVSPELAKEISSILANSESRVTNSEISAYWFPRKNIVFGKWIQHGIWYPDRQLRLFQRGKGKFPGKHNHEYLEVKGETGELSSHLIHENYQYISQYIDKINHSYTDNEVVNLLQSGKKIEWVDAVRMPASDFILNFFRRQSYKDGLHGLVLSILQTFYAFVVFAKAWERQGFWEYNSKDFARNVRKEATAKGKEFSWWYAKSIVPWFLKPKSIVKKLLGRGV